MVERRPEGYQRLAPQACLVVAEDLRDVSADPGVQIRIVDRVALLWIGVQVDQVRIGERQRRVG